jgi:hypothetical protein
MTDWPAANEFTAALSSLLREKLPTQLKIVSIAKLALEQRTVRRLFCVLAGRDSLVVWSKSV